MSTTTEESRTIPELKERAAELGVADDERVSRSNGHRPRKAHWVEVVQEAEEGRVPTQAQMIRDALVEGLTNQEIQERAQDHHEGMLADRDPATAVSRTIGTERAKASDWWLSNRDIITEHRPRVKYETPEEEAA